MFYLPHPSLQNVMCMRMCIHIMCTLNEFTAVYYILGMTFSRNSFQDGYFTHKIIQQTQVVLTKLLEMATI